MSSRLKSRVTPRGTARLSRRQRVAAIVLATVAVALLTLDLTGGSLRTAHSGARGVLGSLYRGTDSVLGPVRRFVQAAPHAAGDQAKIDALRHENAVLRHRLADSKTDLRTAAQLRRLRLAASSGQYRVQPARVIAISPAEGFDWTVTIDAGTSQHVRAGQSVTDGDGLVGRVLSADAQTSVVLLSVDPKVGVGARDVRTGQVGVASGLGTAGFSFRPLNPAATVHVGDRLETGPSASSSYVSGLAIGTITTVRRAPSGDVVAVAVPRTSPTALDLVGVIISGAGAKTDLAGGR